MTMQAARSVLRDGLKSWPRSVKFTTCNPRSLLRCNPLIGGSIRPKTTTATSDTDVFAEKYTPVFGSHLGKVLDRPAIQDDVASYTYAELYGLAGAIRNLIVNKVPCANSKQNISSMEKNNLFET